jgi:hypothetical protein
MVEFGPPESISYPDAKTVLPAGRPRRPTVTGRVRNGEPLRQGQSNIRTEILQGSGIEVAINATHPSQDQVTALMEVLQEHGGRPGNWTRIEERFGAKAYYHDSPESSSSSFFAKVRLLPGESGVSAQPDQQSGRQEIEITPKIRNIINSERTQQLARDGGFPDVTLIEALASFTDPDGREVMIYPFQDGEQPVQPQLEEISEAGSQEEKLNIFIMRLRSHFLKQGIHPEDLGVDQLIITNGDGSNKRICLTDTEKFKEVKIPKLKGELTPISATEIASIDAQGPLNDIEPIILPVTSDITLVAANNLARPTGRLAPRFNHVINGADYLIMQGPDVVITNTFADAAVKKAVAMDKQVMLFNEERDVTQQAIETGMHPDLAGFYTLFPLIFQHVASGTANELLQPATMRELMGRLRNMSQVYRDIPEDRLRNSLTIWTIGTSQAMARGETFAGMDPVRDFMLSLRDATMLTPQAIKFIKKLPGQKALLVDQLTAPVLLNALQGKTPRKRTSWKNFVHNLSPDEKRGLKEFLISLNLRDPVVSLLRPPTREATE